MADGGTIFLDEVAEMAPDIQVKLLRSLESRTVRRLGGKKEITVDIRVVAATNKDLQKALADDELREDLYYRLAVVELFLPPLRERVGDVKLLATEFLARFAQQNGKKITGFDDATWEWILSHNWPGNVRELKNVVESAVIMAKSSTITLVDIVPRRLRLADMSGGVTIAAGSTMADARRQLVLRTLASMGGDVERTAKTLGIAAQDVRSEIGSILGGNGSRTVAPAVAAPKNAAPSSAKDAKSKTKPKGRR
jgi:transcriptional regulator with PAS, ATPase and Fis domain